MAWARAVWNEDGKSFAGTCPYNWIDEEKKVLRWPVKINSLRAMNEERTPEENWRTFQLIKIKLRSGIHVLQHLICVQCSIGTTADFLCFKELRI